MVFRYSRGKVGAQQIFITQIKFFSRTVKKRIRDRETFVKLIKVFKRLFNFHRMAFTSTLHYILPTDKLLLL